jgi:two-component system response regulator MprA
MRHSATILVVDDQPEVRAVLRRILERTGNYAVAEVSGASEALDVLGTEAPDAVLLDISMPRMSGISVIPQVRTRAPGTKILVLSSHEEMEDEILAMGADAFLPKHTPQKQVLTTLARVLAS